MLEFSLCNNSVQNKSDEAEQTKVCIDNEADAQLKTQLQEQPPPTSSCVETHDKPIEPPAENSSPRVEHEAAHESSNQDDVFPDFSELNDDINDDDLDNEFDSDNANGFQCEACDSKFMSETSMRIHAVKCNKTRRSADVTSKSELKR